MGIHHAAGARGPCGSLAPAKSKSTDMNPTPSLCKPDDLFREFQTGRGRLPGWFSLWPFSSYTDEASNFKTGLGEVCLPVTAGRRPRAGWPTCEMR